MLARHLEEEAVHRGDTWLVQLGGREAEAADAAAKRTGAEAQVAELQSRLAAADGAVAQLGQNGRLGGATAGHHGLPRLHLQA